MTQASTQSESEQPLCPEGDFRFWTGVGAGALLLLSAAYMLGLQALFHKVGPEGVGVLRRVSGVLSNCVWVGLCTGAGSLAIATVALVRRRRAGSALDIACRAFACVSVANLVHLVPLNVDVIKLGFDVSAFLVSVTFLGRAAFRIRPLDAAAAVALAGGTVAALTAVAYAIVWAVLPR